MKDVIRERDVLFHGLGPLRGPLRTLAPRCCRACWPVLLSFTLLLFIYGASGRPDPFAFTAQLSRVRSQKLRCFRSLFCPRVLYAENTLCVRVG